MALARLRQLRWSLPVSRSVSPSSVLTPHDAPLPTVQAISSTPPTGASSYRGSRYLSDGLLRNAWLSDGLAHRLNRGTPSASLCNHLRIVILTCRLWALTMRPTVGRRPTTRPAEEDKWYLDATGSESPRSPALRSA